MSESMFIGVDVGTAAVKAAVFDVGGTSRAAAQRRYEIHRPQPGWADQEPLDWWNGLVDVIGELGDSVDLSTVRAIGVCGQVNTHVFVDGAGQALLPAIVWQDQRCAHIARRMDGALSDDDRRSLWGGPFTIDSSFSLVRLAWLAEQRPDLRARTRWILYPKDYVNLRLTGQVATDHMSPVGVVGSHRNYLRPVLELVEGATECQPPIRAFTSVLGRVCAPELPALQDVPVAVGTMDAWGSVYGSGLVEHATAMETCGTSEILAVASRLSIPTVGVISFPPFEGLTVHAGPTQAGGDAVRWWAEGQGRTIEDVLVAAAQVEPGGPIFHPYLAGERAPLWDAEARATFFGVTAEHDFRHFSRAVLEGVAYSARHLLEELEKAAGVGVDWVNASGGGSKSDLWCQIKADVLGRELRRLQVLDSGVLGAGLMGAVAAGLFPDLPAAARETVAVERVFSASAAESARYARAYKIYRDLYDALRPSYRALAGAG